LHVAITKYLEQVDALKKPNTRRKYEAVTSKSELGFYPKRWEDREIPAPVELIEELRKHTHRPNSQFVFPSPTTNREQHMLDHCKSIAKRAKRDPTKFDLKTFRSTYATGMLRRGFDVRTVRHWVGHKSFETTMRYLAPATDVHYELDLVTIPSVEKATPKVCRARNPFSSERRTIACTRRRQATVKNSQ
jgi:integrase